MAVIRLHVIICEKPAGMLWQDERGLMHFRYGADYAGIPLSHNIPVSNRTYAQDAVRPFLFGLLPDNPLQRAAIAEQFGVKANNPVAMLAHIGLDCPGGVQFCPEEQMGEALSRYARYVPLQEHEIERKLRMLRTDNDASWLGSSERWSLGGNQGKFALAWHHGAWCSAKGSAPTTHIFKNGVAGFRLQALNEYVCLKLAERCGVGAVRASYQMFGEEPALIVERYDRLFHQDGSVTRIHQEDCCQALGVMPEQKYTSDGGPAAHDVLGLYAHTNRGAFNARMFTLMLFFNYLVGGTDAHAKNYSMLYDPNGTELIAPLYDVASGLAYDRLRHRGRIAMSIGGENRFGRVGAGSLRRYAQTAQAAGSDITYEVCRATMMDLAQEIPVSIAEVFDEIVAQGIPGAAELRERLEGPIVENCRTTLALL